MFSSTGFGLLVGVFGAIVVLLLIVVASQTRKQIKEKHTTTKHFEKNKRHSLGGSGSVTPGSDTGLSYDDIYGASECADLQMPRNIAETIDGRTLLASFTKNPSRRDLSDSKKSIVTQEVSDGVAL